MERVDRGVDIRDQVHGRAMGAGFDRGGSAVGATRILMDTLTAGARVQAMYVTVGVTREMREYVPHAPFGKAGRGTHIVVGQRLDAGS
jgi:hypothetical protein